MHERRLHFVPERAGARSASLHLPRMGGTSQLNGPIRQAWTLAGMVDAINDGDAELAKAIGLLGLASLDQAAVDGGSWLLASEISLEASPPFGAFARPRTLDQFEARQTRLLDARWVSILMGRIRERDAYHAAKRSLGGGGGAGQPGGGAPNAGRDSPSTEGRPDPKGDKKGEKVVVAETRETSPSELGASASVAVHCV